jgi:hypothetical protein
MVNYLQDTHNEAQLKDVEVKFPPGEWKRRYTIKHDGAEVHGVDAVSSKGVMKSFEGHMGCAASIQLVCALVNGEPTQIYIDEINVPDTRTYRYITAEWNYPPISGASRPEKRLNNRPYVESEVISLGQLEDRAMDWLRTDD